MHTLPAAGQCLQRCFRAREHHSFPALPCPAPRPRQEFYTDLKDAEREGEVNRILSAFKLNPYEQMNLHNDATPEEVRRQYRKVGGALGSELFSMELAVTLYAGSG